MTKRYWLMKSEPDVYSIDDLKKDQTTWWEGVRNYQARNFMMQDMQIGDEVLFYHSNATPPGIAGLGQISALAAPDQQQFQKKSEYYDPKATPQKPIWFCTQVRFVKKWKSLISLELIKADKKLAKMVVVQKGSRLSIQPVSAEDFHYITQLAEAVGKK